MEQVTRTNLPIVGRIQHGEQQFINQRKRVTELGYFIAKTKNSNMNFLLNRFDEKYPKQTFLNVTFFNEDPLTIRRIRYNQGGAVSGTTKGKQKVSNKWQDIECSSNCKYCIKQEGANKPACNYEGTLKFMLPEISEDRIWIMKVTGQQSISNLEEYIGFQKYLGNSLKGTYTIFLNQIEQTNAEGKKFNNFVIDIVKTEDFNSNNNSISQNDTKNSIISTKNTNNVENTIPSQSQTQTQTETEKNTKKGTKTSKQTKKSTKTNDTNAVSSMETEKVDSNLEQPQITNEPNQNAPQTYKEHCFLYDTEYKNFKKAGKDTEYLIAKVTDENDKTTDVVVKPEFREKMEKCDIGTELILELQKFGENIISKNIDFVRPILKKVAA